MDTPEHITFLNLGKDAISVSFAPIENPEIINRIQEILLENYQLPCHPCKMQKTMR